MGHYQMSADIIEQAHRDARQCRKTGGQWHMSPFSKPGQCACPRGQIFRQEEGCTTYHR